MASIPDIKINLGALLENVTCGLCSGYLVDAHTILECCHSFCRSCLLKNLKTSEVCSKCGSKIYVSGPMQNVRLDEKLQDLVYTIVPNLYKDEMCRRREFYTDQLQHTVNGKKPEAADKISTCLCLFDQPPPFSEGKAECLDKRYLECASNLPMDILKKFVRRKFLLSDNFEAEFYIGNSRVPDFYEVRDVMAVYGQARNSMLTFQYIVRDQNYQFLKKLRCPVKTKKKKLKDKSMKKSAKRLKSEQASCSFGSSNTELYETSTASILDESKVSKSVDELEQPSALQTLPLKKKMRGRPRLKKNISKAMPKPIPDKLFTPNGTPYFPLKIKKEVTNTKYSSVLEQKVDVAISTANGGEMEFPTVAASEVVSSATSTTVPVSQSVLQSSVKPLASTAASSSGSLLRDILQNGYVGAASPSSSQSSFTLDSHAVDSISPEIQSPAQLAKPSTSATSTSHTSLPNHPTAMSTPATPTTHVLNIPNSLETSLTHGLPVGQMISLTKSASSLPAPAVKRKRGRPPKAEVEARKSLPPVLNNNNSQAFPSPEQFKKKVGRKSKTKKPTDPLITTPNGKHEIPIQSQSAAKRAFLTQPKQSQFEPQFMHQFQFGMPQENPMLSQPVPKRAFLQRPKQNQLEPQFAGMPQYRYAMPHDIPAQSQSAAKRTFLQRPRQNQFEPQFTHRYQFGMPHGSSMKQMQYVNAMNGVPPRIMYNQPRLNGHTTLVMPGDVGSVVRVSQNGALMDNVCSDVGSNNGGGVLISPDVKEKKKDDLNIEKKRKNLNNIVSTLCKADKVKVGGMVNGNGTLPSPCSPVDEFHKVHQMKGRPASEPSPRSGTDVLTEYFQKSIRADQMRVEQQRAEQLRMDKLRADELKTIQTAHSSYGLPSAADLHRANDLPLDLTKRS